MATNIDEAQKTGGIELRPVGNDDQRKPSAEEGVHATLKKVKGKLTTIGRKYLTTERSSDCGLALTSSQPQVLILLLAVLLSFILSLVAVILASVALKNPTGSSVVNKGSLPSRQTSLGSNSSTGTFLF